MAAIAALAFVGPILGAFGKLEEGKEARRTGEINAQLIRRDAALTVVAAEQDIRDLNRRSTLMRGETVAIAAGSGSTTSGSVAAILADQAVAAAIDRARIEFNTEKRDEGLRFQAGEVRRAGRIARNQSQLSAAAGLFGAFGGAAGGAGVGAGTSVGASGGG